MYSTYFKIFILDKKYILKNWYPNLKKSYFTISENYLDLYIKFAILCKVISFFLILSSTLFMNKNSKQENSIKIHSFIFGIKYCELMLFFSWISSFFNSSNSILSISIIITTLLFNEMYSYLIYNYIHHMIFYLNIPYSIWLYYLTYSNIYIYLNN